MTYEISSDERFASSLDYIACRVLDKNVTCETTHAAERMTLCLKAKCDISSTILDAISDIIITDLKAFYITESIKLPIRDPLCACAFTSVLSAFDRDTDKIIAKTIIKITPKLNLDSLYEFGLYILKNRWNEVIHLANENICYLVCQKTFMELLRFLISNVDVISEEAHIVQSGERFEVLGAGLSQIKGIYINQSLPNDVQVVNKLVAIAPKRIFLHVHDAHLQSTIQNIFGGVAVIEQIATCTVAN